MPSRRALLVLALLAPVARAAPNAAEQGRIDTLIRAVEGETTLKFIRNGRTYSSGDAARFLREKLKTMGSKVQTAEDFIDQIATRSSTTGQPYLIRLLPMAAEQPAADFLRARLTPR